MNLISRLFLGLILAGLPAGTFAKEFHVAISGDDTHAGTKASPFRTIQRAADVAQPGDIITVHSGIYRERVTPPRGGTSDRARIVYQAACGEKVVIKGSEPVRNWMKATNDTWKAVVPNTMFGGFNPYTNEIHGDWFTPKGRKHHTGAVYLNGHWLFEAVSREEVLAPVGTPPSWLAGAGQGYLLNVAWFRSPTDGAKILATAYGAQQGIQNAPCDEGGDCIGFIENGDWARYEGLDLSSGQIEFRGASATQGGIIEIRQGTPEGELLGSCLIPNTGGWQAWSSFKAKVKPVAGRGPVCLLFKPRRSEQPRVLDAQLWFAEVDDTRTTLWAQFKGADPNQELVEANVRQTVFYPDRPGRNFITVRGFMLTQAATPWAPPTAEQIGLIGTHWSKGWIIEDNHISYSVCSGVALGKYGDQWDNTSANTAEGYVKTIERALQNGWNRDTIGHHIVRNNHISHCEQTGIVGSLGSAFCTVTGNTIHDIHVRRLFTGAEMAGIKFHAAIDTVIQGNHIYHTCLGLWLDWMAQGTRVSANLFHDNGRDLFLEVDHGPFLVDNNLFLSPASLLDMSEGGAYVHNLFRGKLTSGPEPNRETPFHPPHTTTVAGLTTIKGGDDRFFNNLFVGDDESGAKGRFGLAGYNTREYPLITGGNIYFNNAAPYNRETNAVVLASDPGLRLVLDDSRAVLHAQFGPELKQAQTRLIETSTLGKAKVPQAAYENPDGSPLKIDRDFFGRKRNKQHPTPGPFETPGTGQLVLKLR